MFSWPQSHWFQTVLSQLLAPPLSKGEKQGPESLKGLLQDLQATSATAGSRIQAVGPVI